MRRGRVRSGLPSFTGVTTYRDPEGRFEFRHPSDWERAELADDRDGVIVRPEVDDPDTYFAVWISSLPEPVIAADLSELQRGFDDGLARLADARVESATETTYGEIVKLDRVLTFSDGGEKRKRRVWGMYVHAWQVLVIWQGSDEHEYDYWYPMANYCFSLFRLPDELWFLTDPEMQS